MEAIAKIWHMEEHVPPRVTTTKTTLYELIKAFSEEVGPGEDWLVAEAVLDLLGNGRIRFLGPKRSNN